MMGNQMIYRTFNPKIHVAFAGLAFGLAVIITVSSLIPAQPSLTVNNMDKILHVAAYAGLGIATLPAFPSIKPVSIWLGLCVFGLVIEVLQGLMPTGRATDILDGLANASGAFLALVAWAILSRLVQKIT